MSAAAADPLTETRRWIRDIVVGHNLCPFAARPLREKKIRIEVTQASNEEALIVELGAQISRLLADEDTETSLLVHPNVLQNFSDYNQFLSAVELVVEKLGVKQKLQIASFHPDYQFAGSPPDDPANYTNRSPYPMLHLLREASITRAVERHGDPDAIPERNVEYLRGLDTQRFEEAFIRPGPAPDLPPDPPSDG